MGGGSQVGLLLAQQLTPDDPHFVDQHPPLPIQWPRDTHTLPARGVRDTRVLRPDNSDTEEGALAAGKQESLKIPT